MPAVAVAGESSAQMIYAMGRMSAFTVIRLFRAEYATHKEKYPIMTGSRPIENLRDARRRIAELEQGIAAIGGAMGSDRLTPIEIERLIYKGNERSEQMQDRIAELEAQLAEARKDGERYRSLYWRPMADLHEEHFPVIAMPVYDPGGFQMFATIDQWNELDEEDAATFDLYLPLACTAREGFCETLDAAIAAAAAEGEKG